MSETRRHALKMLGTIGATCAFPFAGDELYGQHVHPPAAQSAAAAPYEPAFFTAAEYGLLSALSDAIIPPTDTPGASAAGAPEYIDRVVSLNAEHQGLARAGLRWLDRQARERFAADFRLLSEAQQVEILTPLSEELDRQQREIQEARFQNSRGERIYYVAITDKRPPDRPGVVVRPPAQGDDRDLPVRFFRLMKNLTADGYYTSRAGLLEELGYQGNTVLGRFPACNVPEH